MAHAAAGTGTALATYGAPDGRQLQPCHLRLAGRCPPGHDRHSCPAWASGNATGSGHVAQNLRLPVCLNEQICAADGERCRSPSRPERLLTTCRASCRERHACASVSVPSPGSPRVVRQLLERRRRGGGKMSAGNSRGASRLRALPLAEEHLAGRPGIVPAVRAGHEHPLERTTVQGSCPGAGSVSQWNTSVFRHDSRITSRTSPPAWPLVEDDERGRKGNSRWPNWSGCIPDNLPS